MPAISFKCPNCGGDLQFDPATQKYKCEYCVSAFTQEELEQANPQAKESAPIREERTEAGADLYSCPSCGAQIVTDSATAATFCYYCHNPVVLQGRLSGEYEPDLVIPFAVDKKTAVSSFLEYVRRKKYVPKDFFCEEQIEKISGVYFPYWLYSCGLDGEWEGTGDQVSSFRSGNKILTKTKVFEIWRRASFNVQNLSRGALNREERQLVEAVQPYQLEGAKEFSMGYLSGFQAEKRDMEKNDVQSGFREEAGRYASQMMHAQLNGYAATRAVRENLEVREESWKYLMLPVWALTYRGRDGKVYYYAMNGQTKKVCGVLPLDKGRLTALFFGIFIPVLLALLAGGYFLW